MTVARVAPGSSVAPVRTVNRRNTTPVAYTMAEAFIACYAVIGYEAVVGLPTQLNYPVVGLGLGALVIARRDAARRVPINGFFVLMLIWIAASLTWSYNPDLTKLMVRTEIPMTIAAVGCAALLPLERFVRALLRSMYAVTALTIAATIAFSSSRAHFSEGVDYLPGWHGLFPHKTTMSSYLIIMLATVLAFEKNPRIRRWCPVLVTVMIVGARSSTGLSALMAMGGVWFWLKRYGRQSRLHRPAFVLLSILTFLIGIAAFVVLLPVIVNLYGKDLTFTGRTQIWSAALWAIRQRWTMGYGRGGVWNRIGLFPTWQLAQRIGFIAGHAHNAYLELLLETGLVGLGLTMANWITTFRATWSRLVSRPSVAHWGVMCLTAQFVISLSESPSFAQWQVLLGWIYVLSKRRDELAFSGSATLAAGPLARDGSGMSVADPLP
jgi:O-antigen ligase